MRVYIKPGHGGPDRGGRAFPGLDEADLNLAISKALRDRLLALGGVTVRMAREDDSGLLAAQELPRRIAEANAWPADVVLAIHNNAHNGTATGTETLVQRHNPAGQDLGRRVQAAVVGVMGRPDRGVKIRDFDTGKFYQHTTPPADWSRDWYQVLRGCTMPAIIIECGFMDHEDDAALLRQPAVIKRLGEAIAEATHAWGVAQGLVVKAQGTPIMGEPVATLAQAREWLRRRAPDYVDMAERYWRIATKYGVRPDIALCQAVKETGSFRFTGLVKPDQNNWCGLAATGTPNGPDAPLRGADPTKVALERGRHGATFATRDIGVEAHVQHLYAYATDAPLPSWATLYSPRFALVNRGSAAIVEHLGATENPKGVGWAYPGTDYGKSIVRDYLASLLAVETPPEPEPPAAGALPIDVVDHWAADAIGKVIAAGIMSGYPDGRFGPDDTITRAQLAVVLVRALSL